jgi:very-short-patch-repair endonuclease
MALRINPVLNGHARAMRREPTRSEKILWRHLSNSQLGGLKFRRQAVIGEKICDFLCPANGLVIEVDGDTHDSDEDRRRDGELYAIGYRVMRFTNAEVMGNIAGVLEAIMALAATLPRRRYSPTPAPPLEGRGS